MSPSRSLVVCLLALAGCNKNPGPPLAPVSGKVTLNDKPLAGALVTFTPAGETRGWGAAGYTGPDGRYTLQSRYGAGVPAGEYTVTVSKRVQPDGSDVPPGDQTPPAESQARETLPPRYSDPGSTELRATVPAGGGTQDFRLEPAGKGR